MELTFRKNADFEKAYVLTSDKNTVKVVVKDKIFYFEGSFFYQMSGGKPRLLKQGEIEKELCEMLSQTTISSFIDTVEGTYVAVCIDPDAKKIIVFGDKFKRKEMYYCDDENEIVVSTGLNAVRSKAKGRNQMGIISAFYLHIPKRHTIFNNIFKLGYNETIELKQGGMEIIVGQDMPLEIEEYADNQIETFTKLVENAIISRSSDVLNVVQMSGGWDSSFMVAVLVKHLGNKKVKGVTAELILSDGTTYNTYEIEKVKKIAEYLGIELDIVRAHLGDGKLLELWKTEIEEKIKDRELYHASLFPQFTMAQHIKDKYGEDTVVFNGECCDSLNNFGFAQYVTIAHENKGFGEYSDKMLCYLYGPTFFNKVLDNSYEKDVVFQILKWYNKDVIFENTSGMSKEDRVFLYLFSFMYAPKRLPFAKLEQSEFINPEKVVEFKRWLRKNYLEKAIKNVTPKTLYYWLFIMYLDFHWQSASNIRKVTESLTNVRLPYFDRNLFEFFAKMPESWGRGLEINNVKYPLKRVIYEGVKNNTFRYPLQIIEESVVHAYNAHLISWPKDFIINSVVSKHYLEKNKLERSEKDLISEDYFDKTRLEEYISRFVKNPAAMNFSPFEWRMITFLMTVE